MSISLRGWPAKAVLGCVLGLALPVLSASVAEAQNRPTACDILTAHPDDPNRVSEPVPWNERDTGRAIPACEEAVRREPNNMRLRFQLGLAQDSAGNHAASIGHYTAAAQGGYVAAGMAVAWALANGEGTARDDVKAAQWYRWAADGGHSGAANTLGFMFENGRGVPRDLNQAAEWYRRAYVTHRRAVSGFNYARLLAAGRGVPQNRAEAVRILRAVVQEGRQDAALHLALMAERNEVPQVSLGEYIQLLALAETRSLEQARARQSLDRAVGQGYAADVAQARRQAADRQAAVTRDDEQRRQRQETAFAAASQQGGGGTAAQRTAPPGAATGRYPEPIIRAEIGVPQRTGPGEAFTVSWTITGNAPPRPPLPRAQASEGQGGAAPQMLLDLNQRWLPSSRRELVVVTLPEAVRVAGIGFIVVPPGARMPYGIEHEPDRLKVVFPLHLAESQNAGQVRVRAFMAGAVDVRVTLLSVPRDGAIETSRDLAQRTMEFVDDRPILLVQDRVTPEPPRERWLSPPNHRGEREYELRVFSNYFDVIQTNNQGALARISGAHPSFSPNGRFIIFRADNTTKIFDAVSQTVVFAEEKALLEAGVFSPSSDIVFFSFFQWGSFYLLSPYVDFFPSSTGISQYPIYHTERCHACIVTSADVYRDSEKFLIGGAGDLSRSTVGIPFLVSSSLPGAQHVQTSTIFRRPSARGDLERNLGPSARWLDVVFPIWMRTAPISDDLSSAVRQNDELNFGVLRQGTSYGAYVSRARQSLVGMQAISASSDIFISQNNADHVRARGLSIQPDISSNSRIAFATVEFLQKMGISFRASTSTTPRQADWGLPDDPRVSAVRGARSVLALLPRDIAQNATVAHTLSAANVNNPFDRSASVEDVFSRHGDMWAWQIAGRDIFLLRVMDNAGGNGVPPAVSWCLITRIEGEARRVFPQLCSRNLPSGPLWAGEKSAERIYIVSASSDGYFITVANRTPGEIWIADTLNGITRSQRFVASEAENILALQISSDNRLLLQTNSDGRFFIYDVAAGALILSGMGLDDEFVIYDEQGFYDATAEGGSYVYRFFPGLREHHSFAQFRNHFHRPDIIRDLIAGRPVTRPSITLLAPPTVEFEARPDPSGTGRVDLSFDLRGSAQLRTLRLFRDGLPLTELPVSGNTARLAHTIQLQPGRHNISAVAYDAQGFSSNVKTAAVQIGQDRRYNGRLRYVGIAVNDYHRMPDQNLGLAVRDAQLLRDSLQGLRSPRRGEVTATVLTDAQATRTAILETLRRAATETGPDDTLVISFAGHGARVGERFFYLPHGGSFADAADSGVEWRLIADALSPAQGRVLVLLDACHSGSASGDNFVPNDAYAEQLMRSGRSGLAVLAASKGRQFSYEDPSLGNGGQGQFTYAIAQALGPDRARADRDRSGTIELDELYAYVKRTVSNSTRANQTGVQTPWLARDEFIGRVSFF